MRLGLDRLREGLILAICRTRSRVMLRNSAISPTLIGSSGGECPHHRDAAGLGVLLYALQEGLIDQVIHPCYPLTCKGLVRFGQPWKCVPPGVHLGGQGLSE